MGRVWFWLDFGSWGAGIDVSKCGDGGAWGELGVGLIQILGTTSWCVFFSDAVVRFVSEMQDGCQSLMCKCVGVYGIVPGRSTSIQRVELKRL